MGDQKFKSQTSVFMLIEATVF